VVVSVVDVVVTGAVVAVPVVVVAKMRRRNGAHIHHRIFLAFCLIFCARRVPVTKLGRLVKDGKIKSMEEIYLFSLPVKEYQIVDFFLPKLKDEVMKIMPVQKQTRAGQRTRFKAFVAIGDFDGHVGLGVKCAKEVATAIRGAIIMAKLSVIPVRRGYWGAMLGEPHTVPSKVSGKVGSVMCRLIPAPRGTGIVAAPASKRLLQLAGVQDVYTQSKGSTATMGNFLKATFAAVRIMHPRRNASSADPLPPSDHKNIRLPHPRSLARNPSVQIPLRRALRAPSARSEEGVLIGVRLIVSIFVTLLSHVVLCEQ
jgi:small subunit ribosomal protein S2e